MDPNTNTTDAAADTTKTTAAAPAAPAADSAPAATPAAAAADAPAEDPQPEYIDALEAARRAAPASEIEKKDWADGALVIVGAGQPTKSEKRPVIVVEARADDGSLVDPTEYATGADLYLRMSDDVEMPGCVPLVTLGLDVEQLSNWGISPDIRFVCVGPSHPAYVGINLAYSRGARAVEVRGLTDFWKERLAPWIARIKTDGRLPAADLDVTLT